LKDNSISYNPVNIEWVPRDEVPFIPIGAKRYCYEETDGDYYTGNRRSTGGR
jgi:hypothetical protein